MAKGAPTELSDFERQRLANIAERDALLKKLTQEAHSAGLYTKPASKVGAPNGAPKSHKRKQAPKKEKEDITPRRTSSRLRGIQADSEVAKRKAEDEYEAAQQVARAKRQRVSGDLALGDIHVSGMKWDGNGNGMFGVDVINKGVAKPYERTFGDDEIKETSDKTLRALRERMSKLELWDAWEPNRLKITPERIYSMSFHPTTSKPLVFAGDKLGNLGIVDASQKTTDLVKKEEEEEDKKPEKLANIDRNPADSDSDEEEDPDPEITTLKPHARTISAMHTHPSAPQTLYTASYDSSIRALDLQKSVAVEIYAPADPSEDEPVSGIDMSATDPHVLYFTTLNGSFGRHDTRESKKATTEIYQLSEKKIGGFSLNPLAPHYLATASLDRTMKLWDLRKITKDLPTLVGEHESRLSVSHAAFNSAGQVATSSYDDSIKIHSFGVGGTTGQAAMGSWKSGFTLPETQMSPETVIRHNCQTGRWVTILKPQWQRHPADGIQKLVIGNMNRFVDVYSADGTQLAQLGGEGITAVPAVAVWHPHDEWIAAGYTE
ncbi:putative wd domain protein [Phaeomoniella chlamydospora]|uniref:DNA damage-binding protein CMR1 n=1 Tax=Phaeomoniella chlamydospora TaxID=158046 RepID=A0A0G2GNM4_PHACM|nr:putative wd domain protein [Phaeomoniella chlamydospora]